MRRSGEITALEQIVRPYCIRYGEVLKRLIIAVSSLFQIISSRFLVHSQSQQ